jgi:uracil-DNA glycosylase family 4
MSQEEADLRLRYLERMGIDVWVPRGEPAPLAQAEAAPRPETTVAQPPQPGLDWDALRAQVAACRQCGLCETRSQTVFGVGDRGSRLMVVGEAPGAEEDRQGEPFVGRAGKLLDAMLFALGRPREQVYIANILKCRPPNNRDPRPEEVAACEPYLQRQLELLQPELILAVGRIAAQNLLKSDAPVGKLRGRVHRYGPRQTPLVVTYHPAYLLRSPREKAKAWQDLKLARSLLS